MVIERNSIEEETISATETATDPAPESGDWPRYLGVMCAAMALIYVLPFFLLRSTLYDSVNPSVFARPLNYAFTTAGVNADVVLFGDSTALLDVDPSQMSSDLGVKALNLANTQPSLIVNDDLTLRRYLASNRPPKVIIFFFAAWDFDYGHNRFDSRPTYEGQELLFRQGTLDEIYAFVKRHPSDAGLFPLKFYATAIEMTSHRVSHATQNAQLAATHGHIDNMDSSVLSDPCVFPVFDLDNIRFDWVRSLAERYATPQTRILFYVAPVPSCTNVASVLSRPYSELPAAPPVVVPPQYFSNDVRYVHPRPFAVPELTRNLTEAVRPMLDPPVAAPSRAQGQPPSTNPRPRIP